MGTRINIKNSKDTFIISKSFNTKNADRDDCKEPMISPDIKVGPQPFDREENKENKKLDIDKVVKIILAIGAICTLIYKLLDWLVFKK
jgi:hypothetical protein